MNSSSATTAAHEIRHGWIVLVIAAQSADRRDVSRDVDDQVVRVLGIEQDQYDALSLPSRSAGISASGWIPALVCRRRHAEGAGRDRRGSAPTQHVVHLSAGTGGRLTRYDHGPAIRTLNVTAGGRGGYRFAGTPPL